MKAVLSLLCAGLLAFAFSACTAPGTATKPAAVTTPPKVTTPTTPAVTTPVRPTTPTVTPTPATAFTPIRIAAGEALTDSKGLKWEGDANYIEGGQTITRDASELTVTNTDKPELFRTEHYSLENIHIKVPNGKYVLKLYFSEDYNGNTSADARLFDWVVKDGTPAAGKVVKEYKNWGPWKASGAFGKAQVESIPVTVTNGQISVVFTAIAENPQVNAIEVLPG